MKYKPLIGDQMSGSIGGITASRNRGGTYFRQRSIPSNPGTGQQSVVRGYFGELSAAWRDDLTSSQRSQWDSYAAATPLTNVLGDPIIVSGLAMYQRGNVGRLQAALDRVDDGPVLTGLPVFTQPTFSIDVANQEIDVTFLNSNSWANNTGAAMLVYVSRPQSLSINYFKGPYRYAGLIAGDDTTPPTSPAAIALPFAVQAGQRVYAQVRVTREDGRLSGAFRGSSDAA